MEDFDDDLDPVGNEDICYKGEKKEEWATSVAALNHLHDTVYPKILEKNLSGGWKRVHEDFPEMETLAPNELNPGYRAFRFVEQEKSKIDPSKANRTEKSALDVYETTSKFMNIMVARVKAHECWKTCINDRKTLTDNEFNNKVLIMGIQFKRCTGTDKEELERRILAASAKFESCKAQLDESMELFKLASKDLAGEEEKQFTEKFNKNNFLNYHKFRKSMTISFRTYDDYFQEQAKLWADVLNSLFDDSTSKSVDKNKAVFSLKDVEALAEAMSKNEMQRKITMEEDEKKKEVDRLKKKINIFKDMCDEAERKLGRLTLEEAKETLEEIKSLHLELKEAMYDEGLQIAERTREYISGRTTLISQLRERVSEMQATKSQEAEIKRNEISANIRTMEAIKLTPLTGPGDFIAWKKNQKFLNTHTDPYKKAAALLGTLKDPQDRKMCECIYDFDKLISILNDKYNHQEKLVPALKNRLDRLPIAETDEMMLDNHRICLNVYEQLKEVGAKGCFDGTVVYNLTQKFTAQAKKDFERFKIMQKRLENQNHGDQTFDDDGFSLNSVGDKKNPLDLEIIDNSPEHRKHFLCFIREEARLLDYTKEQEEVCADCHKSLKNCSCRKKSRSKMHLYNFEINQVCPCCNSDEPHTNNFNKPTSSIGRCPVFRDMPIDERKEYAKTIKACYICLVPGHTAKECSIRTNCKKCKNAKHHPLLCGRQQMNEEGDESEGEAEGGNPQ